MGRGRRFRVVTSGRVGVWFGLEWVVDSVFLVDYGAVGSGVCVWIGLIGVGASPRSF